MPDPNKHAALEAAGFAIQKVCGTCKWWEPESANPLDDWWAPCTKIPYEHQKHSGVKLAGTPFIGGCDSHELAFGPLLRHVGNDYMERYA